LSSPRVATINNQKAVIKVGTDRFYVTNISSNTNSGGSGTATTSNSVTLTPFFSGISLDVTPQIDEDDYVTIHIHPIVSEVTEDPRTFNTGGTTGQNTDVPMAKSTTRESDSIVRAKNGQVIVIGGLMENRRNDTQSSTPIADRLPGVGALFKNTDKSASKYELIILLRPIVVGNNNNVWQQRLQESANSFKNIKSSKGQFGYNIVPIKNVSMPTTAPRPITKK
jgi:MSHA biogenesis protein MshL